MRKSFALALVLAALVCGCQHTTSNQNPTTVFKTDSVFLKEYVVKKINEHELRLISIKDTVTLYMENTYSFNERIVYIKK